jgi:hypothetical protein
MIQCLAVGLVLATSVIAASLIIERLSVPDLHAGKPNHSPKLEPYYMPQITKVR